MTSEVALMNRLAVALAADSATTVTYFEEGERRSRFFKGANKIFNLSTKQPVGLMINGTAALQRLPWEIIVKKYRQSRSGKAFDHLPDYATDFFRYIVSKELFPAEYQEQQLIEGISESIGTTAFTILREQGVVSAKTDVERREQASQALADQFKVIDAEPYISDTAKKLAEEVDKKFLPKIDAEFRSGSLFALIEKLVDISQLYAVGVKAFFTPDFTTMGKTGLVITGYGNNDIFPRLEQYEFFGVLVGLPIFRRVDDDCRSITFDVPSEIVPIAQDVMANTFMFGASIDVLIRVQQIFEKEFAKLTQHLIAAGKIANAAEIEPLTQAAIGNARGSVRDYIHKDANKLRRVIGMMPVGELAELAETLVSLESLKERTTRETESVSGPVDVAVITKGDGFIWVKRKHYFDPALNLRFVAKKQSESA